MKQKRNMKKRKNNNRMKKSNVIGLTIGIVVVIVTVSLICCPRWQ